MILQNRNIGSDGRQNYKNQCEIDGRKKNCEDVEQNYLLHTHKSWKVTFALLRNCYEV